MDYARNFGGDDDLVELLRSHGAGDAPPCNRRLQLPNPTLSEHLRTVAGKVLRSLAAVPHTWRHSERRHIRHIHACMHAYKTYIHTEAFQSLAVELNETSDEPDETSDEPDEIF